MVRGSRRARHDERQGRTILRRKYFSLNLMRSNNYLRLLPLPLFLFLPGCSDAPKTAEQKAPTKPLEALTGRQAFQQMYPQARGWAPDAQPLQIKSLKLAEVKADKGKAGV